MLKIIFVTKCETNNIDEEINVDNQNITILKISSLEKIRINKAKHLMYSMLEKIA